MIETLPKLPDAIPLYTRAFASARRKPAGDATVTPMEVRVPGIKASARNLAAYRDICGFGRSEEMPITYPQVLITSLHLWLMTQPQFPFPLLGIIHLRNRNEQKRPLLLGETFEVRAALGPGRRIPGALIFDLKAEFIDSTGSVVYNSVTTPLVRLQTDGRGGGKMPEPVLPAMTPFASFTAEGNVGRKYAMISGDCNPIHLHPMTARIFGFKQAIAHGMWSIARCVGALEPSLGTKPSLMTCQYRAPMMLPTELSLERCAAAAGGAEFALWNSDRSTLYLNGALK